MPYDTQRPGRNVENFVERMFHGIARFWQRVSEGMEIAELWARFMAETRASYDFYAREVNMTRVEFEKPGHRAWRIIKALFWAMILKLSPPRRVVLLISLVFAFFPFGDVVHDQDNVRFTMVHDSTLHFWGAMGLLFLLCLELADRVIMKRDLEIAREIQHWLVPSDAPRLPGFDVAFSSRSANTVGGDYYDAFLRGTDLNQRLLLVVADVAGKSVPASLLMATFQASLRTLADAPTSLAELVGGLNRYACAHSLGGRRFTTAFFAEIDPTTREFSYIRAGHCSPYLRRASGTIEMLEAGQLPLGIEAHMHFQPVTGKLNTGDVLLIYTDGVIEAFNEHDEEFGESRLRDALTVAPKDSAEGIRKYIVGAVDNFVGFTRQHDDITLLVLCVL